MASKIPLSLSPELCLEWEVQDRIGQNVCRKKQTMATLRRATVTF